MVSSSSKTRKKALPAALLSLGMCAFAGVFHFDYIFSVNDQRVGQVTRVALEHIVTPSSSSSSTNHNHDDDDNKGKEQKTRLSELVVVGGGTENTTTTATATDNNDDVKHWQDEINKRDSQIVRMQKMMGEMEKNMEILQQQVTNLTAATPPAAPAANPGVISGKITDNQVKLIGEKPRGQPINEQQQQKRPVNNGGGTTAAATTNTNTNGPPPPSLFPNKQQQQVANLTTATPTAPAANLRVGSGKITTTDTSAEPEANPKANGKVPDTIKLLREKRQQQQRQLQQPRQQQRLQNQQKRQMENKGVVGRKVAWNGDGGGGTTVTTTTAATTSTTTSNVIPKGGGPPPPTLFPNKTLSYENFLRATNFTALHPHRRFQPSSNNPNDTLLDACLVHVGKTAGSTISCVVGNIKVPTCLPGSNQSKAFAQYRNNSKLATVLRRTGPKKNWRHMWSNKCQLDRNKQHLVVATTRDPITRLISAFNYEKKDCNQKSRTQNLGCQDIYKTCYQDMESLAATGLREAFQDNKINSLPHKVLNMTCPQRALGFVTGTRNFWRYNHHWYNYEFYLPFLLFPGSDNLSPQTNKHPLWRMDGVQAIDLAMHRLPTHQIVVLRNEHLVQDWDAVDSLLGGNGTMGKEIFANYLNPSKKQSLSSEALRYLCQALCVEIQYYKLTLWWSSNLSAEDIETSMSTLRESCPAEPSRIRRCSDVPNVGRQRDPPYKKEGRLLGSVGVGKPRLKIWGPPRKSPL